MSGEKAEQAGGKNPGIGIIGVGGIANDGHLPGYQKAGLNVIAAADCSREALDRANDQWGIGKVFADYHDMLALPEIKIVDITTPPMVKGPQVLDAIKAGKHVLVQKPLARSFDEAKKIVEAAEKAGVLLAVHQQARWIPALLPVKGWIKDGYIGKPYFCLFTQRNYWQPPEGSWKTQLDPFIIIQNGIHYLDLLREWFGEPKLVYAIATRDETNYINGELVTVISLEFDNALRACFINDMCYRCGDGGSKICVEGTGGSISGDFDSDSIMLSSDKLPAPGVKEYKADGKWFPDAFSGPMLDLIEAIREGREPRTSGRDNLKTLQVIFAAYRSIKEKRAVNPKEIE
ncbi:MAG: Gfo/Idh/MocA family oxidoreductase [Spirochaetes bacterium]|nr:Gfo/Idh/MocA family oxidoreductase [Spirochaetota bacterium]